MLFLGLSRSIWLGVTIFGLLTQISSREIDSNQLKTQSVFWKVESIQLMTQVAFQGIDYESVHNSCRSQGTDSDQLMTQASSQIIYSESTHDSSEKHLILSQLVIQLRAMPMFAARGVGVGAEGQCPGR